MMQADLLKHIFLLADENVNSSEIHISFDRAEPAMPGYQRQAFYYINNPDGTIRWVFPTHAKYPTHLFLYNSASFKAKVYTQLTHLAFRFGLQKRLTSGKFFLYWKGKLPFFELCEQFPGLSCAVFTGTRGENRKSVIALADRKRAKYFCKVAHTKSARSLISNEIHFLQKLQKKALCYAELPLPHELSNSRINIISNVRPQNFFQSSFWTNQHMNALFEWHGKSNHMEKIVNSDWYPTVKEKLEKLPQQEALDTSMDMEAVARIRSHLDQLFHALSPGSELPHVMAHCDFTPWNMYVDENKLFVYDWELAKERMPILFDLFHFIYQSGNLLQRVPFQQIKIQIESALDHPKAQELIQKSGHCADTWHLLFLLYMASYYLPIYFQMPQVFEQCHWNIVLWDEALTHYLATIKQPFHPSSKKPKLVESQ